MSGRLISDHKFFAGGPGKNAVLPDGVHTKVESSAEGAGAVGKYEDTTEAIKSMQEKSKSKIKGHPMKDGYRN